MLPEEEMLTQALCVFAMDVSCEPVCAHGSH